MRLNRHNTFRNFEARFTGICFNDNDAPSSGGGAPASGGDPGGGGGGNGGGAPALPSNGGGQVQENAVHSFGNPSPPSQDHVTRVSDLLAKGPEEHLSFDDIHALISFDGPLKPTTPAAPAQPNAATPTPAPANPTPAPAAPAAPTISPDAQAIIEAVKQMQGSAPAAPATPDPTPEAPRPYYGGEVPALQVSPQLLSALIGSEDPAVLAQAAPAVNALANGIMNRVMADMSQRMQNTLAAALSTHVPQTVQQLQQVNQLESKFYGTFKNLDKPAIRPVVAQLSNLYAQAQRKTDPNFTWTDEHFKTVAALTVRHFERQGFSIAGAGPITTNAPRAPTNPTQPAAQPAPQQPYMSQGSARPSVVAPQANQSADLVAFVL